MRVACVIALLALMKIAPTRYRISAWMDRAGQEGDLSLYDRVLSYTGPQPEVYERLVQASLDRGDYRAAQVYLYALADLVGWNPARREELRGILELTGDTQQAAALLRFSLTDQQESPQTLQALAQQQFDEQAWNDAQRTLEKLLTLDPGNAWAMYRLGLLLAPSNQQQAAILLQQSLLAYPSAQAVLAALATYDSYSRTDAHTYLGVTLVGLGEWAFAEHVLQLALDVNTINPTALAYLGFVRDQLGRDGLPDLEAALAMNPNDPSIHYLIGLHWRLAQDHEAAYDAFLQAYWLDPENPALAVEVATSLQNLGDFAGAAGWFQEAVTLAPGAAEWLRIQAAFYADTGFLLDENGLTIIEQAAEAVPSDPDILTSLGWAYYQVGKFEQAFDRLNDAVSQKPSNPRARYYFAVILEHRGDRDGAIDSYWFVLQSTGPDSRFGILAGRALDRLGYQQR